MAPERVRIKYSLSGLLDDEDEDNIERYRNLRGRIKHNEDKAETYRPFSLATRSRQDKHLQGYCKYVMRGKVEDGIVDPDNLSDEVISKYCFPAPRDGDNFTELVRQMKEYLEFYAMDSKSALDAEQNISVSTLLQCKQAIVERILEVYREYDIPQPSKNMLDTELTRHANYVQREHDLWSVSTREKTYMFAPEIAYLLDHDLKTTKCLEYAECQHLAWTLMLTLGLRPSSLGPQDVSTQDSKAQFPFLTFGDCKITRQESGGFKMDVTIRNLKTNDGYVAQRKLRNKVLRLTVTSPLKIQHLALSPVLRILAIGIRRSALQQYTTLGELLQGDHMQITFKKEFWNEPIMRAGSHRGLKMTEKVLSAHSIGLYLESRGLRAGFLDSVSPYSIRRGTATVWTRSYGPDRARSFLGHEPGSKTLEKHYLKDQPDLAAPAYGQTATEIPLDDNVLLWERMSDEQRVYLFEVTLKERISELEAEAKDYPLNGSKMQRQSYDLILKKTAMKDVVSTLKAEQANQLTLPEVQARKSDIIGHKTHFNVKLLEIATREGVLSESRGHLVPSSALGPQSTNSFDVPEFASPDAQTHPFLTELSKIPYTDGVRIALTMMLHNPMPDVVVVQAGLCPWCVKLPHMPKRDKKWFWPKDKIMRHMYPPNGKDRVHSRAAQFENQIRALALEDGTLFRCPYCVELAPDCTSLTVWKAPQSVKDHVKRSTMDSCDVRVDTLKTRKFARQHEELKRQGGWYDDDFERGPGSRPKIVQVLEPRESDSEPDLIDQLSIKKVGEKRRKRNLPSNPDPEQSKEKETKPRALRKGVGGMSRHRAKAPAAVPIPSLKVQGQGSPGQWLFEDEANHKSQHLPQSSLDTRIHTPQSDSDDDIVLPSKRIKRPSSGSITEAGRRTLPSTIVGSIEEESQHQPAFEQPAIEPPGKMRQPIQRSTSHDGTDSDEFTDRENRKEKWLATRKGRQEVSTKHAGKSSVSSLFETNGTQGNPVVLSDEE
ncbi:hypothetical protein LTR70_006994 [Exophiala xenobiotica]|uniref:Uncharacterized protein n=1 Tax=Lithohypha guttulata TaxID=1690604 RepID=A0ABR0K5Z1_9EURO|nr:hypothetical protein LTR24_006467 [Lithohypha guttulata]KAK5314880.1 hypothetical protein LTR70_006994 [Exophiala xenobiotica]